MDYVINYYDINGDTKGVYLRHIDTPAEIVAAVNAIALGGNFIQEITEHRAEKR